MRTERVVAGLIAAACTLSAGCELAAVEAGDETEVRDDADAGPGSSTQAIASSSIRCSGYSAPFVPANAADVDLRTWWLEEGAGAWLQLEQDDVRRIDGVAIGWHRGDQRRYRYSIATSLDGVTFTTVVGSAWSSGGTRALETTAFASHEARFVRLVFEAGEQDEWVGVAELEWLNDLVAPTVAITDPSPSAAVVGGRVGISGTAGDDLDGADVLAIEVHLDGATEYVVAAPGDDGSYARWSASFAVAPGRHTALAVAYDHAGNTSAATVEFDVAALPEPYLFAAGFETGDVTEWTAGGLGGASGGGHVTSAVARSGNYAWEAYNDPALAGADAVSASLLRAPIRAREAFFSAWYLWPEDYAVGDGTSGYANIFQWKEPTEPYGAVWILAAMTSPRGVDALAIHDPRHGEIHWTGAAVPKGRWFNVEAYRKAGAVDGALTFWLDGVEVFSVTGVDTDGASTDPDAVAWGVGNLCGAVDRALYVDDVAVASRRLYGATPHAR